MKFQNPSNALFRLIKSMSAGEKRFFNMLCKRHSKVNGKSYFKLFKAIDKQTHHDEALLKKELQLSGIKYIETKRYLYNLVLDSMAHHYSSKEDRNVYQKLLELEVLLEKGLFDLYELLLFRLRKEAEEKDDFLVVLETYKREKKVQLQKNTYYDHHQLKEMEALEKHNIELFTEAEKYFQLSSIIIRYQGSYVKTSSKAFLEIARDPLFTDSERPRSVLARRYFHNLRGAYYRILEKHQAAFNEHRKEMEIMESNPVFQKSNPQIALSAYINYIISCHNIKEYEKGLEAVSKCKNFIAHFPELKSKKMIEIYIEELLILKDSGNRESSFKLISEINKKIEKEEIMIPAFIRLLFYLNAGFTCFNFGENHQSLKWCNKILNFPEAEKNHFLYYYNALILQQFNILDTKDVELLRYRLKSLIRFLLKRGTPGNIDKSIINFFRQIVDGKYIEDRKKFTHPANQLKASVLHEIKNSSEEGVLLSYGDFSTWIDRQ